MAIRLGPDGGASRPRNISPGIGASGGGRAKNTSCTYTQGVNPNGTRWVGASCSGNSPSQSNPSNTNRLLHWA